MELRTRVGAVAVGLAAGLTALVVFLRPSPPRDETLAPHEPVRSSDRVRSRLDQLRTDHPGWHKGAGSEIPVRSGLPAKPEHAIPLAPAVQSGPHAQPRPGEDIAPEQSTDTLSNEEIEDIPAMKKIALEDPDSDRRLAAVTMLSGSEDPEVIPVFAKALSDQDEEVRMAALQALSDFTDEPPVEAIENALNDPTPDIRFEALSVLADIGDERARTAIEKALNDPDEDVRNLAEGILDLGSLYEPAPEAPNAPGQAPLAAQDQPAR